jgi:hypothetical protein
LASSTPLARHIPEKFSAVQLNSVLRAVVIGLQAVQGPSIALQANPSSMGKSFNLKHCGTALSIVTMRAPCKAIAKSSLLITIVVYYTV